MADWKLGYHANCWGPLGGDPVGVTSIKDLSYKTFGIMETAFSEIGSVGYRGVEIFDGNLLDYQGRIPNLRAQLSESGLQLIAAYSGGNFIFPDILQEELWRIERVASLAAEAEAIHLVVGGGAKRMSKPLDDDYKRLGEALDKVADIAERHGLEAHYHPHLTTLAETPEEVRKVLSLSRIKFCPDTAHLAAAGGDPASIMDEHSDRITYVHLKGLRREPFGFTPLGQGDLDMVPIVQHLRKRRFSGWITVELDSWETPRDGAEQSFRYVTHALQAPSPANS